MPPRCVVALRTLVQAIVDGCRRRFGSRRLGASAAGLLEDADDGPPPPGPWRDAGVARAGVVVRALSGRVVFQGEGSANTRASEIVAGICSQTGDAPDTLRLLAGPAVLRHAATLGTVDPPEEGKTLELTFVKSSAPPVSVKATSGSKIEVRSIRGQKMVQMLLCHFDRNYRFLSLGEFGAMDNMKYVMTSNDDKGTPGDRVMWQLDLAVAATVFLNFRSLPHAQHTAAAAWLARDGWELTDLRGTVSTGVPNGPYQGPVYKRDVDAGTLDLCGSQCGEGVYFVFVQVHL